MGGGFSFARPHSFWYVRSTMKILIALCCLAFVSCGTTVTFTPDGVVVVPPPAPIVIPVK